MPKNLSNLQSWIKYLKQNKEIKQNWTGVETLISAFAYCLTGIAKVLFLERRLDPRLVPT